MAGPRAPAAVAHRIVVRRTRPAPALVLLVLALLLLAPLGASCAPAAPPAPPTLLPATPPATVTLASPTTAPTLAPTVTPAPTQPPTAVPTPVAPTVVPTLVPSPPPTLAPSPTALARPSLQDAVMATLAQHQPATIGLVVTQLSSGQTVRINAEQSFSAASLYKLFVLRAAMSAIDAGQLDPNAELVVSRASVAADPYADLQAGTRLSVDCALRTMIEMSGNSAADALLQRLGLPAVRASMRDLTHSALQPDGAVTAAADVAQVLEAIARGEATSPDASQRMLALLAAQQHNDRLPVPLPLGVRVAHKTGELPGVRHDAGIVEAPSGPYVFVALVADAPSEAAARATIVDLSAAVYAALEPSGLERYQGLPPRLARETFRLPDAAGHLTLLGDPRTETVPISAAGVTPADEPAAAEARLRPEALGDLSALQQAAAAAGASFWVRDGFRPPGDADAAQAVPSEWLLPCAVEQPARVADRPVPQASGVASQRWLGTVVSLTDDPHGPPTAADDTASPVGRWLLAHAPEFGFVPTVRDTQPSQRDPWTLRWIGRTMALRLQPAPSSNPDAAAAGLSSALAQAEAELDRQAPASTTPPPWDLSQRCWTIATTSTQGCPSRWYFLDLPLS